MKKILIIEDHAIVRQGIRVLLRDQAGYQIVAESSDGLDTLALCREHAPDLMLLDLSLGATNGMDVIQRVTRDFPKIRILVFSGFEEGQYAVRALKAGACGFVSKLQMLEELLLAIQTVLQGKNYLSPSMAQSLSNWVQNSDLKPLHQDLTDRDFQTIQMIAAGLKTSQIGAALCLSAKTISTYRHRALQKLGMHTNSELIAYAIRNKLLRSEPMAEETGAAKPSPARELRARR